MAQNTMKLGKKMVVIDIATEEEKELMKKHKKVTSLGYEVVDLYIDDKDDNRLYVVVKRTHDYAIGAGYDLKTGSWAAGYYCFDTVKNARDFLLEKYKNVKNLDMYSKEKQKLSDRIKAINKIINFLK